MGRMHRIVVSALTVLFVLALAPEAEAQRGRGRARTIDGVRFDVHLDLGWHEAFGVGFRVDIPIVPDGFIRSSRIRDELALSPGAELFFWSWHDHYDGPNHRGYWDYHHNGAGFMPLIAAQWNIYFNESWSVFPEVGLTTYWFWHSHNVDDSSHAHFRAGPLFSVGARWHFSDRNALLFRISWPVGFQFGITF